MRELVLMALALAAPAVAAPATPPQAVVQSPDESLSLPKFGRVSIYRPKGPSRGLVLFLSGDGGWNLGVIDMARILAGEGVTVAGLSVPAWLKATERDDAECVDLAAELREAARVIGAREAVPALPPVVAGYSSGATLAYAAMVQGGPGAFRGGLSLGFGPDQAGQKGWCRGAGLSAERITKPERGWLFAADPKLYAPWIVLQGMSDEVVSPAVTRAFTARIPAARLVELPKVGHGFSVQRNWVPQFSAEFRRMLDATARGEVRGGAR